MYECPNCGGNMKFDIPSQMLKCAQCGSLADPYSFNKETDAESTDLYETTVFTCPQCGGEIIGSETSAAEFCSFCGASTILSSRLDKSRRPNYIIPFSKTKEDCKNAYMKLVRKAIFAPHDLKDKSRIESFRAIYIPYWSYYISQNGNISFPGEKSYRRGDYVITDHFRLSCYIDAYYKGMSFDASSSFDDNISSAIAPYDVRGMKEFTPAILSGFYADVADVDCNIYVEDAKSFANSNSTSKLNREPAFGGIVPKLPVNPGQINSVFHTNCEQIDSAMFPVYFMSYRKKDRVAYSIVNGQTGKATADIPVSVTKYFLGSLIIALPIFLLLNLIMTVTPITVVSVSAILSLVTQIIYLCELSKIIKREARDDDKGYQYSIGHKRAAARSSAKKKKSKMTFKGCVALVISALIIIVPMSIVLFSVIKSLMLPICTVASLVLMLCTIKKYTDQPSHKGLPVFIIEFAATCVGAIVCLVNPVSDIWFYACAILILITVVMTNLTIIGRYNILATRRLPQFNRKGGDDRA